MENKRFLLWMEILGYKNWIISNEGKAPIEDLHQLIEEVYSNIRAAPDDPYDCLMLSDTLLVVSKECSLLDLVNLSTISQMLNKRLLTMGLLSRGVISIGTFNTLLKNKEIVLSGTAVVDAASIESDIDAFAVVLCLPL